MFVAIISRANKRGTAGIGTSFLQKKREQNSDAKEKGKCVSHFVNVGFLSVVCVSFRRLARR